MILLSLLLFSVYSFAEFEYTAEVGLRYKQFEDDKEDSTGDYQLDLKTKFQGDYTWEDYRAHIGFYSRVDQANSRRNIINFDELYLKREYETSSWSVGNHVFNWSVLEIFHPVDTINSKNFDSNGDLVERLGQPSILFHKDFENSYIQFILFLVNQKSILPDESNRNGAKIDFKNAQYVNDDKDVSNRPDMQEFVVRYHHTFDSLDLDFHFARKYDTNNPLISTPKTNNTSPTINDLDITPYYLKMNQYGATAQFNWGAFLFKLEAAFYDYEQDRVTLFIPPVTNLTNTKEDYSLNAIGIERNFTYNNDTEGTLFIEYQTILGTTIEDARVLSPFQRDAAIGYRHNFNDFKGNEITAVLVNDMDKYEERIYSLSHGVRIFEGWKLETSLRIIEAQKPSNQLDQSSFEGLRAIANGDSFTIELIKFF